MNGTGRTAGALIQTHTVIFSILDEMPVATAEIPQWEASGGHHGRESMALAKDARRLAKDLRRGRIDALWMAGQEPITALRGAPICVVTRAARGLHLP